jgi:dTDP-4-dehydrorhamnose reductase
MLASSFKLLFGYGVTHCLSRSELDITNKKNVYSVIERLRPGIIIHAAAYTNVEACELEKESAFAINTNGTKLLVDALKKYSPDSLFIYLSSTGVYGLGKERAYQESDTPEPTTVHHRSKYEAEKEVIGNLKNFLIIRTGWLFGGSMAHSKNFAFKRYLEAKDKSSVYGDPTQFGNPTYVNDLAEQIKLLIEKNELGIFNCVGEGGCSRLDYVKAIIEEFELDCMVTAAPDGFFSRIAPVSFNESAENYNLIQKKINIMRPWRVALKDYIDKLKDEINGKES